MTLLRVLAAWLHGELIAIPAAQATPEKGGRVKPGSHADGGARDESGGESSGQRREGQI